MITRNDILTFLGATVSVLSDIKEILEVVPDFETLLHDLDMFKDFLKHNRDKQN